MYCKKCKYHAFDHVSTCPKCGVSWEEARKSLFLNWMTTNERPWTSAASDTSDTPRPPATSDIFQTEETADISLNADLSLSDGEDFSDDLLLETLAATQQQLAQKDEADPFPELDFNLDGDQLKDSADAQDSTSTIPELDFSLDTPATESSASLSAPQENPQAADSDKLKIDLPPLTLDHDAPNPSKTPISTGPQEDLLIPGLEEIFSSTATNEPEGSGANKTAEDDIVLDLNKPLSS